MAEPSMRIYTQVTCFKPVNYQIARLHADDAFKNRVFRNILPNYTERRNTTIKKWRRSAVQKKRQQQVAN